MEQLLITEQYIKDNSTVDINVSSKITKSAIYQAQRVFIRNKYLGEVLYAKILEDVENETLSGHYETLFENYIKPAMVYFTIYSIFPLLDIKLKNTGIVHQSGDNSSNVELKTIQWRQEQIKTTAESFGNDIVNYLKNNRKEFPELNVHQDIKPTDSPWSSPLVL